MYLTIEILDYCHYLINSCDRDAVDIRKLCHKSPSYCLEYKNHMSIKFLMKLSKNRFIIYRIYCKLYELIPKPKNWKKIHINQGSKKHNYENYSFCHQG